MTSSTYLPLAPPSHLSPFCQHDSFTVLQEVMLFFKAKITIRDHRRTRIAQNKPAVSFFASKVMDVESVARVHTATQLVCLHVQYEQFREIPHRP